MSMKPADGLGTQLRRLLEMLDGELEGIYRAAHPFYTPRYTPVMKALEKHPQLTIKQIAELSSVSHSAASQTVSKLAEHGLVELTPDTDRRNRKVSLTSEGQRLLPWLSRHWQATAAAERELDRELSHPLGALLQQALEQLQARPFSERVCSQYVREDASR